MTRADYIVSACLAGRNCRYDGAARPCEEIIKLVEEGRAIPVCPESMAGLPRPRPPAEQQPDGSIKDKTGRILSSQFEKGAENALKIALASGCNKAILKARSPSCGIDQVYDGSFSGTLRPGNGIFAKKLLAAGFKVMSEDTFILE